MPLRRTITYILIGYFAIIAALGIIYIIVPPVSTLMLARWVTFNSVKHKAVPIKNISRTLLHAVVTAEDDAFCTHWGIDWNSMGKTIESASNGDRPRGASTISMQVAKNLFLWPQRSYVRKIFELPIAFYLDLIWSKKRMMEVYLSVAEWGNGIFGAEAAARAYFKKSASQLTVREASLLAAALPNPIKRHPDKPSPGHREYSNSIINRMSYSNISCL